MVESEVSTRTYEVEFADGSAIRVDIPDSWKVTFGPVIGADGVQTRKGEYAVKVLAFRAWESDTKQRLLLTGVISFRDISLPMKTRAVRKYGTESWMEDDGKWTGQKALEVQKSWVDIDQIDTRPPETQNVKADEEDWNGPSKRRI